ncbi:MAG TPA: tetratricopeptide repeat protein, partial [Phaeodactylibacter sp.]|nr:tetratricopeptide repeat protein [Phaeodactylibacter sp.]
MTPSSNTQQHIQQLLDKAQGFFIQSNHIEAIPLAEQAATLANKENCTEEFIQANILLSRLALRNAQYAGKKSQCAFQFIRILENLEASAKSQIIIAIQSGEIYTYNEAFDEASTQLRHALQLSQKDNYLQGVLLALCALSRLSAKQNLLEEALETIENATALLQNTDTPIAEEIQADVYHTLSQIHLRRQEYNKLHESCQKALALSQSTRDIAKEMVASNNLGIYHATLMDKKTAMQHFLHALDISKQIGYRAMTGQYLINIATLYAQLYNFDEASLRYNTLLQEYDDTINDRTRLIVFNNLGNIQLTLEKPEDAQEHFEKSLQLARSIQYKEMIAHTLAQLARTNILLNRYDLAKQQMNEAARLIKALGDVNGKQINLINEGSILLHEEKFSDAIKLISKGV